MDQTWHPEHFFCAHCGKVFGDDGLSQGDISLLLPITLPGTCSSPSQPLYSPLPILLSPPQVSMSAVGNPTASRTLWSSSPPSARAVSGH